MFNYFLWHYQQGFPTLLIIVKNLFVFLYSYFSVPVLLKTLFFPWKKGVRRYQGPGFYLDKILDVWVFNSLSSIIGASIRSLTIFCWLIVTVEMLLLSFVIILLFLFIPLVSLPIYLYWQKKQANNPTIFLKKQKNNSGKLFKKIFSQNFCQFAFIRLEIPLEKPLDFFKKLNTVEEEAFFQKAISAEEPTWENLIMVFLNNFSPLKKLLEEKRIAQADFLAVFSWWRRLEERKERNLYFWEPSNLQKIKSLGKDWAYGYTVNLDNYCQDLNKETLNLAPMIGREKEIEEIERILSKRGKNNVLLIGEPGVGKKTILLNFAQRIAQGKTTATLSYKRVLFFDLNSLISKEFTIEAQRARLLEILKEAKEAGNIILVINGFDKFVSSGLGRVDLTEVFKETIGGSDIQMVGVITPEDYQQYLLRNQTILKLFEKVEVFPPNKDQALEILENQAILFEKKLKISISYFALKEIINRVEDLITEVPFPEKAISFLDEAVIYTLNNLKTNFLTKEIVDQLLSAKTKVPLTAITEGEKDKLLNLENYLSQRVIGQKEAVVSLGRAMRRGRIKTGTKKPIGTFLFLGPTGVGKTETAKALANLYFGSPERMIRLDMAEFVGQNAIGRLVGSQFGTQGILTISVRDTPFGVLLLDEFEKTTDEILNLFLTVFDEGYLKDERGKNVSFSNLIIIATSNAGAEFIREKVNQGVKDENLSKELVEYVLKERIFSPELINRFDGVVVFKPLDYSSLEKIAELMLEKLNEQLKKEQDFSVKTTPDLIKKIAILGYNQTFGARPMRRVIQDKIESPLAKMILEGKVKKGEEVTLEI